MTAEPKALEDVRDFYLWLSDRQKLVFLAILSNRLTIEGRGFQMELAGEQLLRALQGLNELQHQISQHIAAIGIERDRYPDEVLWNILREKAEGHGIRSSLDRSLMFARRHDFANENGERKT